MQRCKVCSNKFTYKDIIKAVWFKGYAPITCSKCYTKHYTNISTRLILSFAIFLPVIIINFIHLIYDNFIFNFLIPYLIWIVITILLIPLFARYHIKSEDDQNDGTKALLTSNLNDSEAEIIVSILELYEIPYLKKIRRVEGTMEVFTGAFSNGIDIYVEPHMVQTSKELINPNNIDEN